ncbi:hypothetical protein ACFW95_43135 [Streptomyces sp. NPDC059474]|uniref:hypothetical protein n=1 Tax=Streptomyces sp. NPDC059474 TaxID=3346846 RepID=UPI0036BD5CD3
MLLRLAYPGVPNAFAMLRLLPMTDRNKDAEILALRHQITVLERQLGKEKNRVTPSDRAFLAALLHRLPPRVPRRPRLLVRPDTVVRWHRNLVKRRPAASCRPPAPPRAPPIDDPDASVRLDIPDTIASAASSTNTNVQRDLHGRGFRQGQPRWLNIHKRERWLLPCRIGKRDCFLCRSAAPCAA